MKSNMRNDRGMLVGVGLDATDGEKRITKGENFVLAGGSEETHDRMTETAIKFNEELSRKGKQISELSRDEFMAELKKRNIGSGIHFRCAHLQKYYCGKLAVMEDPA